MQTYPPNHGPSSATAEAVQIKENGVIGCLVNHGGEELTPALIRLLGHSPDSFDDKRYGAIARIVWRLRRDGREVNSVTVRKELMGTDETELAALALQLLAADLPVDLAELDAADLWHAYQRRRLTGLLTEAADAATRRPDAASDILARLPGELIAISDAASDGTRPSEWTAHLDKATCPASTLSQLTVPKREAILGEWFRQGDLGFIFGARGLGKTWLALHLARQIAEGGTVAAWTVQKPRRVLYCDGEMPLDGMRWRDAALTSTPTDGMFYLHHEALFHLTGKVLNLTSPAVQAAVLEKCLRENIEVLVLDNLSCLFSGMAENDADAWEMVLPWLLELRRNRIAVVFIAHAGRNGFMRGTSRREDAAFWILQLSECKDAGEVQDGARFVARFAKNRNSTEAECPAVEWQFIVPKGEPLARISWKRLSTASIFRQWIEDGVTSASDIAEEMGLSKGQVSKLARKAILAGWLAKSGRDYILTGQA